MDVLVGSSSSAAATSSLVLNQNDAVRGGLNGAGSSDSFSCTSSSSIGAPDDSADNEDDKADVTDSEEVQSEFNARGLMMTSLGSMNSLEDSLPIKRGLSNYFSGKSKSFASLSDVVTTASTVKEIEKKDNPINKRRRVLIASKWHRNSLSSSFYNNANPKSMPLLLASLNEDDEEEEETQQELSSSDEKEPSMIRTPRLVDRGLKKSGFKSMSCYCLSDLQGHDEH